MIISIIIPIYNTEKYLERCLESILNQSYRDIEVILVNDGSVDESLKICTRYKKNDSRIVVINQENQGVSIARNIGIENANGEYIMFIDADDWIEPNMCEIMYHSIINENADIIFTNHIMEYKCKSKPITFNLLNKQIIKENIQNQIILPLIEENKNNLIHNIASFRSPWGKLFKRSIINENNIRFNKDLIIGEDFIFNLQYLKYCKKVVMKDEYLYHYRMNEESALNKYKEDAWKLYKDLLMNLESYLKENFKEEQYFNRLNKLKIKYFMICIQNEMNPLNNKNILERRKRIKDMCNDEIVKIPLGKYSKGINGKKNKVKLFLLRNKIYLPFAMR